MTEGDRLFRLDRMALDDIGAGSIRLATAIHAQLGPIDGPVAVYDIARALDIEEIREEPLRGLEGALITTPERDVGRILVNASSHRGRRRFSVAHELLHFLNPYHRPTTEQGFVCTSRDMGRAARGEDSKLWVHQQQEIDANVFAIELLTPRARLRRYLRHAADMSHVLALAEAFDISKEAAARRYVSLHEQALAVVFSKAGQFTYLGRSLTFPEVRLRNGDRMPVLPTAAGRSKLSSVDRADAEDWLRRPAATQLFCQTLWQSHGYAMTLLLLDEEGEDDDRNELFDRFAITRK